MDQLEWIPPDVLIQLRAQDRPGAVQRGRQPADFLQGAAHRLRRERLRCGIQLVEAGLSGLPGGGHLGDPLADDRRVGAGLQRRPVAGKAPVTVGQELPGGGPLDPAVWGRRSTSRR